MKMGDFIIEFNVNMLNVQCKLTLKFKVEVLFMFKIY